MTDKKVKELLEKAYFAEVETIINYMSWSVNLETFDGRDVAEELEKDITEEQNHALRLGKRLKMLGYNVKPSFEIRKNFEQEKLNNIHHNENVESVIRGVIAAEEDAIKTYKELITIARKNEDYGTARLAEELLIDEEEHLQEFKDLLKEFQ